jgi:dephospho-CoA kinase
LIRIGLTGNIAAGKSVVAAAWEQAGVPVVRADDLARQAAGRGSAPLRAIAARFGAGLVREDGELDRDRLREIVFRDPEARRDLEGILHPAIRALRAEWIEGRRAEGASLVASEVPLLYELGMEDEFDVVVVVDAPEPLREERLVRDRGLVPAEARRIIASQGSPKAKREKADYVLENVGTEEDLHRAALALLPRIQEEWRG